MAHCWRVGGGARGSKYKSLTAGEVERVDLTILNNWDWSFIISSIAFGRRKWVVQNWVGVVVWEIEFAVYAPMAVRRRRESEVGGEPANWCMVL